MTESRIDTGDRSGTAAADGFSDIAADHRDLIADLDRYREHPDDAAVQATCTAISRHLEAAEAAVHPHVRRLELADRARLEQHADDLARDYAEAKRAIDDRRGTPLFSPSSRRAAYDPRSLLGSPLV